MTPVAGASAGPRHRDVIVTVGSRVAIIGANLVATVIVARFLQPAGRGEYFFVVSLAQVAAQFATLGLASSNTYYVAKDRGLLASLLANSLWVTSLVGPAAGCLGVVLVRAFGSAATPGTAWVAIALAPLVLFFLLGTNLLVGIGDIDRYNRVQVGANLGLLAALAVTGVVAPRVVPFLGAFFFGWLAACLVLVRMLRRNGGALAFRRDVLAAGMRYSAKAYIATVCGFLIMRGGVFVLGRTHAMADVGQYSIALQIGEVLGILPASWALVLFPNLVAVDRDQWRRTATALWRVGAIHAAACVVAAVAARPVIGLVFGQAFLPAVPVLYLLLPGVFFLGLTSVISQFLAARGFPVQQAILWVVGVVVFAGLCVGLVPSQGPAGAAIALTVTQTAVFVMAAATALHVRWKAS
jgi:O-antigen/teichoic acid export membrane protein